MGTLGFTKWNADGSLQQYDVYILSNTSMTLYIGITNDLEIPLYQHFVERSVEFTSRYHFDRLVYFEPYDAPDDAIAREKQLKGWRRKKKLDLIKKMNPEWKDLSATWREQRILRSFDRSPPLRGGSLLRMTEIRLP
ncbi:MAG TPA: GIY-YIG nuclease family protein [Thermoanaerobaculia bacterium]